MSETNWTLEVRAAGTGAASDDAANADAVRELTLEQLRREMAAGTIGPDDEVRSTFALDGKWRAASDIEALAATQAPEPRLPSHLPFAIAGVVIALAYAAILGANTLKTNSSTAMWLLIPIVGIAALAFLLTQNRPPLKENWHVATLAATALAIGVGIFLDANWLGGTLVGSVCVSLTLSGIAARLVDRAGADPTWRALCAFAVPLATLIGGFARTSPTWFSDTGTPNDMLGLWAFAGAVVALPILVINRFRGEQTT